MKKAGEEIVDNLVAYGIDHVFGVPGGITINLINEFYKVKDKIKVILTRNEQTASIMANAYGRLTGKPGVFIAQGPYAASIGLFGALESFTGSAPMLILTDITDYGAFALHYPAQSGSGEPGTFDLRSILKSTCKYVATPNTPEDAVQAVQQGIKFSVSGRPGPSAVILRSSNFSQPLKPEVFPKLHPISSYVYSKKPQADPGGIEEALNLLYEANLPVIIAGNGIHIAKAYSQLRAFAELTTTPVATSNMGRGAIDETHELSVGTLGAFGHPLANSVVRDSDLLLVLGSRLKPQDTCYENPKIIDPNRQKIVQVDCEPENIACNFPVHLGIIGDLKLVLEQLLLAAKPFNWMKKKGRSKEILSRKLGMNHLDDPTLQSESRPILPQRLVYEIRQNIPKDTLVFTDAGNNRFWMGRYFPAKEGAYFVPGGTLSMSCAAPSAVVGKMLFPNRPCLAVAGDGGFMMESHVLSTVVQYETPIVFIIFNNSCLGMVTENQGDHLIGSEFIDSNFAEIAKGFGVEGKRIEHPEELRESIREAFASKKPYLLDVVVSNSEKIYKQLLAPEAREVFNILTNHGLFFPKA
jgi:acetolactate synthase-1/2/3 large subunit